MEETFILIGIIIILILIIAFLISNKNKNKNINTIIDTKGMHQTLGDNPEEILKNLKMQNLTGPIKTSKITTQQTVKKVIYQNGEKVSEETSNTENEIHSEAFTNCPNCGAKIENPNITNCPYCNTSLTNRNTITKIDS